MNPLRRTLLAGLPALAAWPALAEAPFPGQPIRLVVPFPPAGATDVVSRLITGKISADTGWNFVVDNRAGAGGNIGLDAVAKAPADGYTLGMGQTANLAVNPALLAKMPFDPLKDFAPVALVASLPVVLVVRTESPHASLASVVSAAKAKPGVLLQALASNGTVGHLAGEMFGRLAGIRFTNVPYKGAGPALTDLIGGQTDFMFGTPQAVTALVRGGKLRALAVTSARRLPVMPDVPTIAESGWPGFEATDWKGLVAPAATPRDVVRKLNAAVNRALGRADTLAALLADGSAPMGGTPEQFAQFLKAEHTRWGKVVREAGIKPD